MRATLIHAATATLFLLPQAASADSQASPRLTIEQRLDVPSSEDALGDAARWLASEADHDIDVQLLDRTAGVLLGRGTTAVSPSLPLAARAVDGEVAWRLELVAEGDALVARVTDLVHTSSTSGALSVDLGTLTLAEDPGAGVCDAPVQQATPCIRGHRAACVVRTCDADWRTKAWRAVSDAVQEDVERMLQGMGASLDAH